MVLSPERRGSELSSRTYGYEDHGACSGETAQADFGLGPAKRPTRASVGAAAEGDVRDIRLSGAEDGPAAGHRGWRADPLSVVARRQHAPGAASRC